MEIEKYVKALLDPFDSEVTQIKIQDGREDLTAAIRFRSVGSLSCDTADASLIALIPGFSNALGYSIAGVTEVAHPAFPSHVDTVDNKAKVKGVRLVSCGLQLSLENSPDENEGYWEAVRIPNVPYTVVDPVTGVISPSNFAAFSSIANYQSFQTGKLRDLHRFQFKLNSRADEHFFQTPADLFDPTFDVILIKIYGRRVAASPSIIRYNVVSNQEIVYDDTTLMSRLQTKNDRIDNIGKVLDKTDYLKPGVQIS